MFDSDDALITACREGDIHAWNTLLDKYERLVFSIPLNYGLSREDAADIAQLTFTILMQSLDSLREDSHLAAWLATVARRHTWRLLEQKKREQIGHAFDISENPLLADESQNRFTNQIEQIQWVHQGLTQLDEKCRQLLLALYFSAEKPAYTEIARQFNMRVGSIGPTRARCLEKLKNILQDIT